MFLIKTKVFLRGAYGPSNLGDDILMLAVIKILSSVFDEGKITVGVDKPNIAKKFNSKINWISLQKPVSADLAVFGGGGQFFSFPTGGKNKGKRGIFKKNRSLIDIAGRVCLEIMNGPGSAFKAKKTAAFCIGVGPFHQKGEGYGRAQNQLSNCEYLSVRDVESSVVCKKMGFGHVRVFTDPSLLSNLWVDANSDLVNGDAVGEEIGFVLRYWPFEDSCRIVTHMIGAANRLKREGYKVTFVFLCKDKDLPTIDGLSGSDCLIYDPTLHTPEEFLGVIKRRFGCMVSVRAHGVLLPAVMGIPSVCVGIEPKLKAVHNMLKNSTKFLGRPTEDDIYKTSLDLYESRKIYQSKLKEDLDVNAQIAKSGVDDFLDYVKSIAREI